MSANYLSTEHMDVGYHGQTLIHDICMDIRQGEIVSLIGPNGAGKSTILKSISRQLQLIGGRVLMPDTDIARMTYGDLAKKMAVVLTQRVKPELLTCYDIVASGRYPYTGRLGRLTEEDEEKVEAALRAVNLLEIGNRDFNQTSDGQKQRILLARAICQDPEIIVLDEPTSFLDIRYKMEILSLLQKMAREDGITVVMSLHEIDLAEKVSDRVVCVKGDRIYYSGPPEEVFCPEIICDLYDIEENRYNTLFGSPELKNPLGAPEIFVVSSGGTGVRVYRQLQKRNIPFAAGILYENDIDLPFAKSLAAEVVTEKPFEPLGDESLAQAQSLMESCREVWYAGAVFGSANKRLYDLLASPRIAEKRRDMADFYTGLR